jgi:hypothetical protein
MCFDCHRHPQMQKERDAEVLCVCAHTLGCNSISNTPSTGWKEAVSGPEYLAEIDSIPYTNGDLTCFIAYCGKKFRAV